MYSQTRHLRRLFQKVAAPLAIFSLVGYFIYHSVQGDRGVLALLQLQTRLTQVQSQLATVLKERQELEEKVCSLRPASIDRDLLDQQVRLTLGYAHPDEIVILTLDKSASVGNE